MADPLFKWDESFLIGIEELDHEHKLLINDINRLHEELARHEEKSEIEMCLGEIYKRMEAHFALEERVMLVHEYQHFDEHKHEHNDLLDGFTEYMVRYLNDTGDPSSIPIEETLERWVVNHILTHDKKMSLMVKEKDSFKKKRPE